MPTQITFVCPSTKLGYETNCCWFCDGGSQYCHDYENDSEYYFVTLQYRRSRNFWEKTLLMSRSHLHIKPTRKARKAIIISRDGVERGYLGAVTGLRGNYGVYIAVTGYMHMAASSKRHVWLSATRLLPAGFT